MNQKLPQHVAIVMDGNGRWAKQRGLPRAQGHQAGIESVKMVVRACISKHIPILSLFAFSSENWSRPQQEVQFLMALFVQALQAEVDALHKNGIRLCFIGDRSVLDASLQVQMKQAETLTRHNEQLLLHVAINYSGKWDIVQAARAWAIDAAKKNIDLNTLDETLFANYLSLAGVPDPDLFIRTSGELRVSNFFLWQLAYTELYFTPVHWPDFNEEVFLNALDSYKKRERRYGMVLPSLIEHSYV